MTWFRKRTANLICGLTAPVVLLLAVFVIIHPPIGPWYNGVAFPSVTELGPFMTETDTHPQIVEDYVAFGAPFPTAQVEQIAKTGALPLLELGPKHELLANIAHGGYDRYLSVWTKALLATGVKIGIDFGHEPNGSWYPWGCHHQTAAEYVHAWRHIHMLIGTYHVTWVWAVNQTIPGTCAISQFWPGKRYVNWVGIDGYLRYPQSTFAAVFDPTIHQLQQLTNRPILIAEAGAVGGPAQPALIKNLYTSAHRTPNVIGVVYFVNKTRKGDYRPQDSPAGLLAYQLAVSDVKGNKT
jgi:mannan endo-1,4-beta-mannosidase